MKIIRTRPPNYAAIVAVFPMASGKNVLFAYDEAVYTLSDAEIPPQLVDHEEAHLTRQKEIGVELWWKKYLEDAHFRYEEELLAHRAEYRSLCVLFPSRQNRRYYLNEVAKRLASPLYGRMITLDKAKKDILA